MSVGAPLLDPVTKTYPWPGDGHVETGDPVWQEVAHRLGIPLGALSFAPDIGIDVQRIRSATRARAQKTVEDAVNQALAPMIERGDVAVVRVVIAMPWTGRWDAWVRNLRDPINQPRPFASR